MLNDTDDIIRQMEHLKLSYLYDKKLLDVGGKENMEFLEKRIEERIKFYTEGNKKIQIKEEKQKEQEVRLKPMNLKVKNKNNG